MCCTLRKVVSQNELIRYQFKEGSPNAPYQNQQDGENITGCTLTCTVATLTYNGLAGDRNTKSDKYKTPSYNQTKRRHRHTYELQKYLF